MSDASPPAGNPAPPPYAFPAPAVRPGYPPPVIPALPQQSYGGWGPRAVAYLIDLAPTLLGLVVYLVSYGLLMVQIIDAAAAEQTPTTFINPGVVVGGLLMLAALPWNIYNRWIVGGKTGQSLGKRVLKLQLLSERTGAPVGAGMAFLRDMCHGLDSITLVGYLWPLFDDRRQTFADKLMQTVVLPASPTTPVSAAGR